MRVGPQELQVRDAEETAARGEDVGISHHAVECRITARAPASDAYFAGVSETGRGEVQDAGDGVVDVFDAPVVLQFVAVGAAVAGRAGVVDVAVGVAAGSEVLGFEGQAWGNVVGWAAVDGDDEGWGCGGGCGEGGVVGGDEDGVGGGGLVGSVGAGEGDLDGLGEY